MGDKPWYVSPETYEYFDAHKKELAAKYDAWQEVFAAWEAANPELAKKTADAMAGVVPDNLDSLMEEFEIGSGVATRNAGATVLQPIAQSMPFYVSGSADLHGSNKNYMKGVGDFSKNNYAGRNFYYGIREHAMGAIMNGMAFYGLFRTSGSTFLVFSDYMRASPRFRTYRPTTSGRTTRSVLARMAQPTSRSRLSPPCASFLTLT